MINSWDCRDNLTSSLFSLARACNNEADQLVPRVKNFSRAWSEFCKVTSKHELTALECTQIEHYMQIISNGFLFCVTPEPLSSSELKNT